ncbi:MAG: V-type ATP synthase subunit I [Tannerella sp.]|jgi:V/A-type H+-transporting ATPase subunit I|nr:V-type ATP synthase subunit I [Tannerella sp.]
MIVKMSKYAFLIYHKEYDTFLNRLREMGAVHVKETQTAADQPQIQQLLAERKRVQTQLRLLKKTRDDKTAAGGEDNTQPAVLAPARPVTAEEGAAQVDHIERLSEQTGEQHTVIQSIEKDIAAISVWGDFDYANITRLQQAGYDVTFFTCPSSRYDTAWNEAYNAFVINELQSANYFITITPHGMPVEIDAERARLPDSSLAQLRERLRIEQERTDELNRKLAAIAAADFRTLEAYDALLSNDLAWKNVHIQTVREAGDKLMMLEGWIPTALEKVLEQTLDRDDYFYRKLKVTPEDDVPIQFKNDRFSRLFELISKLYMLPKYGELDLTPFFAPFFMIFFGLCLGDSGYGLFLLLAASAAKMFMRKKIQPSMMPVLSLVQILGASTFFCGLLTGTFFGAGMYDWGIPALDVLKAHVFLDNNQMFALALILGVVQILFGMCLNATNRIIRFGFVYGLSTIGWIILLVSMGVAYLLPGAMPMFGTIHLAVISLSGILIFLLNSPGKNPLFNIGLGLWDTYNMATGLLGDVLSYVRLFALGLSGGILAGVFNSLATGMSPDNIIVGPIVMTLIFVVGHAINIFMNVLGAFVHPMRLTFVEFFKNSGYEGGGSAYNPFKWNK